MRPEPPIPPAIVQEAEESLAALAARINDREQQVAQSVLDHAREQGELLLRAKARLGHGDWLPWLRANVTVKDRQARNYMALARGWDRVKSAVTADLTIEGALRLIAANDLPAEESPTPEQAGALLARGAAALKEALAMGREILSDPSTPPEMVVRIRDAASDTANEAAEYLLHVQRKLGQLLQPEPVEPEPDTPPTQATPMTWEEFDSRLDEIERQYLRMTADAEAERRAALRALAREQEDDRP